MSNDIIVIGCGLLGQHVYTECERRDLNVRLATRDDFDIRDGKAALQWIRSIGGLVVVNCAAYTDVDKAEAEEDVVYSVNALGAQNIARAAEICQMQLIHISTDFVLHSSTACPAGEYTHPNARGVYAQSKLLGEHLVRRVSPSSVIVRVGGLYGKGGQNFGSSLVDRIRAGEELSLDGERIFQPTWARCAAERIVDFIQRRTRGGIYHATCTGHTTWFEFGLAMARAIKTDHYSIGRRCPTLTPAGAAPRPASSILESRVAELEGFLIMPGWHAAMLEYLESA